MHTEVLPANADAIARAAAVLQGGGLVAFPTETVYGLGANALDFRAVAGIFAAKGRPSSNPLIIHVANTAEAARLAGGWPDTASMLAEHFWPGPLTLVVPTSPLIPSLITAGGPTVAIRVPAHPVAQALLRAAGMPLAAPSANRSSGISPTRAEHVLADLQGRIELILDAGPTPGGLESTVLDLTSLPPTLLRPGLVRPLQLEEVLGPITRQPAGVEGEPAKSPGMLARHYSPLTPLQLCQGTGWPQVKKLMDVAQRVGWLTFGEPLPDLDKSQGIALAMPTDSVGYAAQLYSALHALDASGVDHIVVAMPPDGEAWLAIHDRLRRAATLVEN